MKIYQRTKEPAKDKAVHFVIRWIWRQMNLQRVSQEDVAKQAGVASSAMRKWRQGINSPRLADVEAVVNVLGGKIVIEVDDGIGTTDQEGSGKRGLHDPEP